MRRAGVAPRAAVFYLAAVASFAFFTTACSDPPTTAIAVTPVTIAITPGSASISVGQTLEFSATVTHDTTGIASGVKWESSIPTTASIDSVSGMLTAHAPGVVTVRARSKFQPLTIATASVSIAGSAFEGPIAIRPTSATILTGFTVQMSVVANSQVHVRYQSSNDTVASVDSITGLVRGLAAGNATIRAVPLEDTTAFAFAPIIVVKTVMPAKGIVLSPLRITPAPGNTFQFSAEGSGFSGPIRFKTSHPGVPIDATSGLATANQALVPATITAYALSDTTIKATALVNTGYFAPTVEPRAGTLLPHATMTFAVTYSSPGKGYSIVTSNASVVTILQQTDDAFTVSANNPGTAFITLTSATDKLSGFSLSIAVLPFPYGVLLPVVGAGVVNERYTSEVASDGTYAYTSTWGTRKASGNAVKIWNISAATPVLVDSLIIANVSTTGDVQISPDGKLLVVATEGLTSGSIVVYDRSSPAAPRFITRYMTENTRNGVHTVKMSTVNGRLYGFLQIDPSAARLVIVDMTNQEDIREVYMKVMGSPYVHDVFVRDGILMAALWGEGITIFDIGGGGRGGSPSNPVVISNVRSKASGPAHNVWWYHDPRDMAKRYVFLGEENSLVSGIGGTTSGDVHVFDVSDLANPREVAMYSAGSGAGAHNFDMDEASGILYAAFYNGGVRAIDVRGDLSSCATSERAAYTSSTGAPLCDLRLARREAGTALSAGGYYTWGVKVVGNRVLASDMLHGLVVLDISALKR